MDPKMLLLFGVLLPLGGFIIILMIFMIRRKKVAGGQSAVLQRMVSDNGNKSSAAFYQNMYTKLINIPLLNRYVYKIRRRLELVTVDDEYMIRNGTARIALKNIITALLASIVLAYINREDLFMIIVSFIGVLIVIENMTERGVNKIEDKLLVQQLDFLSEVRHAFHTTSMVEEAIYDASILDEYEITAQANRIYEIMISADPEIELEKYYDVAPNRFLKAFAGVSYLTKEFGDRKIDGVSLYLKDLNNITQELQLEVLKRDKLDYLFKSLTYIAVLPVLAIKPLEEWAMSSFNSTVDFYDGKLGFLTQTLLLVVIFVSYALLTRIKDSDVVAKTFSFGNDVWQEKVYRMPIIENIIDGLIPSPTTKKYASLKHLLKDTASNLKVEWFYINRVVCSLMCFAVAIIVAMQMHKLAITSVMYSATTGEKSTFGQMSEQDTLNANGLTSFDRFFLNVLMEDNEMLNAVRTKERSEALEIITNEVYRLSTQKLDDMTAEKFAKRIYKEMNSATGLKKTEIQYAIIESRIELPREGFSTSLAEQIIANAKEQGVTSTTVKIIEQSLIDVYTQPLTMEQASVASTRIYEKLLILTSEYFSWFELAIAILIGLIMYQGPILLLMFQRKMRYMEMEDEVMQFQTIILMLMHIERISVEYMLEWLARFSNIFREPLTRCLNNYESGAYEALEELKDDAPFKPFVRIVESFQAAVESVKITDAFDELESERNFFQEKRKEANERLIQRKAKIGRVIGFAPMVTLFVGYLIIPLMIASLGDMGSYFTEMGSSL